MKYSDRMKLDRWQMATGLVDSVMPAWKQSIPSDPHAETNIRYAVAMATLTPDEADMTPEAHAAMLPRYIRTYAGEKYQAALLADCQRIVRSVLAHHPLTDESRCTASSWGGKSHQPYGPQGMNRCTKNVLPVHEHADEFGNVFTFNPDAAGGRTDPRVRITGRVEVKP
jgi:hypothetical protein